jgi:hypothetical protein
MKTLKKVPVELVECQYVPEVLEPGKLYYSEKYSTVVHLCLCGCGHKTAIPIGPGGWTITVKDGKPTLTPSLLHRFECRSHYIITNGVANFV